VCIPCRLPPNDATTWHNLFVLIYAGIDEAGYGPMLGPLCVGCSIFAVEDADPADGPPNLWARLDEVVTRGARDARRRIAIDDSKKLKVYVQNGQMWPKSFITHSKLIENKIAPINQSGDEL
jgi:hypothetical protein